LYNGGTYTVENVNTNVTIEIIFKQVLIVTVSSGPNNTGLTDKDGSNNKVDLNGSLTIRPAPATGYRVSTVKISGIDVPSNGNGTYTIKNVLSNLSVDVSFTKITYKVLVTSDTNGSTGLANVSNDVLFDESITFTPIPNTGYQLLNVKKDGINVAASGNGSYTFSNVSSNIKVIVTFTKKTFVVTVPAVSNGSTGLSNVSNNVLYNDSLIISPVPDTGYRVLAVTKGGENVPANGNGSYTIINVSSNLQVDINFTKIRYQIKVICDANGLANGGTGTTTTEIEYQGSFSIEYSPDIGYRVNRIIKNGTNITDNALIYTGGTFSVTDVNENVTIELTFKKIHTVTVSTPNTLFGTTSPTGANIVDINSSLTITPAPLPGYRVLGVTNAYNNGNGTYTVANITSNIEVIVTFKKIFSVTVTTGANGSTNKNGSNNVDINGYLIIKPIPNPGYQIDQFKINGNIISKILNKPPFKISNVTADVDVNITFSIINYQINIICGQNGTTNATGITNKIYGESLTFTPSPSNGYRVLNVTNATNNNNGTYTVANISSNKSVFVTFSKNYIVTINCGANGSTDATGDNNKFYGDILTFRPTPNPGYRIGTVTNATNNRNGTYTVNKITSDIVVNVTFII
jgi:hypothetical protein